MENKKEIKLTLEELLDEFRRRNYGEGYNEGYNEGHKNCQSLCFRLYEASQVLIGFLKSPVSERSEGDLKNIIVEMNEAIKQAKEAF